MTTSAVLTLDTDEARRALAHCTRLLLKWADDAAPGDEFGDLTPEAAGTPARKTEHNDSISSLINLEERPT
jgi:hypothetical protein